MNENKIEVFRSAEFGAVRTIRTADGKVLFCGKDVANALGYKDTAYAISAHCKGVEEIPTPTAGGYQIMKFITEGNVYRLITHSKLPNAEHFESWVFDEVLPEIRQTGSYGNISLEDVISKTVAVAVSETIKALVPLINQSAPSATAMSDDEQPKRIRKKYRYTTPSKISMLEPTLKQKVDEMIVSGEYSCQQIANFIMNNSDTEISQMAVNRYRRINFV